MVKFKCQIQTNIAERRSLYGDLNTIRLESNSQIKINFDGGVRQFDVEDIAGRNLVW